MTNLTVVRPHISAYLPKDYNLRESSYCQDLGLAYSTEIPAEGSFILITDTHIHLEDLQHEQLQRIKLIIHPNSGFDNLNLSLIKNYSLPVIIGNSIRASAVTEYILSCLFSYFSSPRFQKRWSSNREWNRPLLSELKILLIGHGHIGSLINKTLTQLGCELLISDPQSKFLIESGEMVNLENCQLSEIDVVILAANQKESSSIIVDKGFLGRLNEKALIINPARGSLIDTKALIDFLKINPSAFAFLDVLEQEPPTIEFINEIEPLKNIQLSSHIAGVYKNIPEAMLSFEKEVLTDYLGMSLEEFLRKYKYKLI